MNRVLVIGSGGAGNSPLASARRSFGVSRIKRVVILRDDTSIAQCLTEAA